MRPRSSFALRGPFSKGSQRKWSRRSDVCCCSSMNARDLAFSSPSSLLQTHLATKNDSAGFRAAKSTAPPPGLASVSKTRWSATKVFPAPAGARTCTCWRPLHSSSFSAWWGVSLSRQRISFSYSSANLE